MPYNYGLLDNADFIADVCKATRLAFLPSAKLRFFQDLNNFVILNDWFGKGKKNIVGGTNVKFQAMVRWENAARHIRESDTDQMTVPNVLETMFAPWVIANTNYAWTKNTVLANDRAESPAVALTRVLDAHRLNALYAISKLLEADAWGAPADDTLAQASTPWGVPYWVVPGATGAAGWTGMNPAGWAHCAGLDASDNANSGWRNYSNRTDAYETVDDACFAMLEKAWMDLQFQAPFKAAQLYEDPNVRKFKIYTSQANVISYRERMRQKNQNLGPDVAAFAGRPVFNGLPLTWVASLDPGQAGEAFGKNFYFIDTDSMDVKVREGDFFAETDPIRLPEQHRKWHVQVDVSYNFVCTNRRKQGVVAPAA